MVIDMKEVIEIKKAEPYILRNFFIKNNITQVDIARALGRDGANISRWMCGNARIPKHVDIKLRNTALYLNENRRTRYKLSPKEEFFCKTKIML